MEVFVSDEKMIEHPTQHIGLEPCKASSDHLRLLFFLLDAFSDGRKALEMLMVLAVGQDLR